LNYFIPLTGDNGERLCTRRSGRQTGILVMSGETYFSLVANEVGCKCTWEFTRRQRTTALNISQLRLVLLYRYVGLPVIYLRIGARAQLTVSRIRTGQTAPGSACYFHFLGNHSAEENETARVVSGDGLQELETCSSGRWPGDAIFPQREGARVYNGSTSKPRLAKEWRFVGPCS
jgi:hypothetical protein